jgi:nucleoside-diphosphate kinase
MMKNTTFIMFKPDAVQRQLVSSILDIFKSNGFSVEMSQEVIVDAPLILAHYEDVIKAVNQPYFQQAILDVFVGKKVYAYVLAKDTEDAVKEVRTLIGATDPAKADPLSIRGKFGDDALANSMAEKRMLRNLIHASDSRESVIKETKLWFGK